MRAGLVIYGSLATLSGGFLYDRQLVSYLQRQGDTVEVISLPWRAYGWRLFDNWSRDLPTLLQLGNYDVVLQDELNHPSLFRLNAALTPRSAPIVSIVHHLRSSEARPAWQNRLYGLVETRYLNSVDAFIYNSETTRGAVESQLAADRPSVVAYPGRDHVQPQVTEDLVRRRAGEGPLRILFVGNVIPRKGLDVLLAAVARLEPTHWTLDIAGDGTVDPAYSRSVTDQIARLPAGSRVTRHGRVDDAALARLLAASHVLAVPSSYEGFGIVFLEALGFGLPVIATRSGAAPEVIEDGVSGFHIESADSAALAERLADLAQDRQRLGEMGVRALERYHRFPTWDETGSQVRRFLLEQIDRHRQVI